MALDVATSAFMEIMMKCVFTVEWHFNNNPDELKTDISTIKLEPHYTVESLTEELHQVIEIERRVNKKSTITDYSMEFINV